ncbi:MAG: hypothetical protein H6Q07_1515 [Acidobacteria bacterium]|nr:hypothetical protein [Acidobacteriota bacterium]
MLFDLWNLCNPWLLLDSCPDAFWTQLSRERSIYR